MLTQALPTQGKIIHIKQSRKMTDLGTSEKVLQSDTLVPRQWCRYDKETANKQKIQNRRNYHRSEPHHRSLCCGTSLCSVAILHHAGLLAKLSGHFQKAYKTKLIENVFSPFSLVGRNNQEAKKILAEMAHAQKNTSGNDRKKIFW